VRSPKPRLKAAATQTALSKITPLRLCATMQERHGPQPLDRPNLPEIQRPEQDSVIVG